MILVTLGTQDKSFERLLREMELLIQQKVIREEVVVQAGYTEYSSQYMKIVDFLPKEELEKLLSSCRFLITHGGVGSIFDGLSHKKKIIAVPRLAQYKEHTNDHQLQVITELGKEGYLLPCFDVKDLKACLTQLKSFVPKPYTGNHELMLSTIDKFIEKEIEHPTNRQGRFVGITICFQVLFLLCFLFFQRFLSLEWVNHLLSFLVSIGFLFFFLTCFGKEKFDHIKKLCLFVLISYGIHFLSFFLFSSFSFWGRWIISFLLSFFFGYIWLFLFWGNLVFMKQRAK